MHALYLELFNTADADIRNDFEDGGQEAMPSARRVKYSAVKYCNDSSSVS